MSAFDEPVNPASLAYAQHQAMEEVAYQRTVVLYRDLYEGDLSNALRAELTRSLLSGDATDIPSAFNYFETVIDEVLNRLAVVNLTSTPASAQGMTQANTGQAGVFLQPEEEEPEGEGEEPEEEGAEEEEEESSEEEPEMSPVREAAPTVQWAMDWWQRSGMDEKQFDLYEKELVDSESFIILQPEAIGPNEFDIVPYVEKRYTAPEAGGDGQGCKMHYQDGRLIMASKRWIEEWTEFTRTITGRERKVEKQESYMTLYIAPQYNLEGQQTVKSQVIKYKKTGSKTSSALSQWEQIGEEEWPHPIPIFHFKAPKNRSRGKNAAGAQILMDNYNIGLAIGASFASLPVLAVLGMYPTTDGEAPDSSGSNVWELASGGVIGDPEKGPETANIEWLRPGDLSQIITAIDQSLNHLAITTGTPALMSQKVRADAAAELIRRIEQRPIATARQAQIKNGNTFTQMFRALRELLNEFTEERVPEGDIYPRWQTADTAVTAIAGTEEQPVMTGYEMNAFERIAASK